MQGETVGEAEPLCRTGFNPGSAGTSGALSPRGEECGQRWAGITVRGIKSGGFQPNGADGMLAGGRLGGQTSPGDTPGTGV